MKRRSARAWLRLAHKWAGLTAAAWLVVLGVTGVLLDHPDYRPLNQLTVPESWGSPDLTRFIRITYMRQIAVDPDDQRRWIGASERGLWRSDDRGGNWRPVGFDGIDFVPQVRALVVDAGRGFDRAIVATDEGLWIRDGADRVVRLALDDRNVTSLANDFEPGRLVGVTDRTRLFALDLDSGDVSWREPAPIEPVIAGEVPLTRYILNNHFGHGLFEGGAGIAVNDLGGIAMLVLGVTGFSYWFVRRRWRRRPEVATAETKRRWTVWLYRSHGPIIGVLGAIPILYLSVTGIFADHIRSIYGWAQEISVPQVLVPAGFSMRSLAHDIQDVVAYPGEPGRLTIATRKGLYESYDGGESWLPNPELPIQKADYGNSLNLFRVGDTLFLGAGVSASFYKAGGAGWAPVTGLITGISSGAASEGQLFLKNSQGVFSGDLAADLVQTDVKPPPLEGMPLFLYLADVHTGLAIHPLFPWVNDLIALCAIVLVISGPIIWWRRKWM